MARKKAVANVLPDSTKVEVVMRKEMTLSEYNKQILLAKSKGWNIQAYKIGFYSEGFKTKINK